MGRRTVPRFVRIAPVLAMSMLSGCGCDLIGCASALRVQLAGLPAVPFTVELIVNGNTVATTGCSTDGQCQQGVNFNTSPTAFSVRVATQTGTRVTDFAGVRYTKSRPNGAGCDPECQTATVTAQVP